MPSSSSNRTDHSKAGGPAGRGIVLGAAALGICALVMAAFSWAGPSRMSDVRAYTQTGQLTYSALTGPASLYGSAGLTTGQVAYADSVGSIDVTYLYSVKSASRLHVTGSEQLLATVSDGLGATRTIPLQQPAAFTGTSFVAHGSVDVKELAAAAASLNRSAGARAPANYRVSISPSVAAAGRLDGQPLHVLFDQGSTLTYVPTTRAGPGALVPGTPTAPATASELVSSSTGSLQIPGGQPATLFSNLTVLDGRIISLLVLAASLIVIGWAGRPLLRDATSDDESVRIETRHGLKLVEVEELPGGSDVVVVTLSRFEGLIQVAHQVECPILHLVGARHDYAVVDNGTMYLYTVPRRLAPVWKGASRGNGNGHGNGHVPESAATIGSLVAPSGANLT